MVTTVAIIQARMTSTRLPGKVMMELGGKPVIQHVIERAQRIKGVDKVILAVPSQLKSIPMAMLSNSLGVPAFTGSEDDVLSRYYLAANTYDADVVVRITGDCPLIDPEICSQVVALRRYEVVDYASNVHPRSFPQGLDCECFTFAALARAFVNATETYDREHVTPFIIRHARRTNLASGRFDLSRHRWTLDTIEDLERLRAIFAAGDPADLASTLKLVEPHAVAA